MAIGTSLALLISGLATAGGGVAGAKIAAGASKNATQAQLDAARAAAESQSQTDREALDFLKEQYKRQLEEEAPAKEARRKALLQLSMLLGLPQDKAFGSGGGSFRPEVTGGLLAPVQPILRHPGTDPSMNYPL